MARRTLLDMTQNILSSMDSDEVNSIGDTVESLQVAEVIKETYDYITVGIEIPGRAGLFTLDAVSDVDRPNYMTMPANVERMEWLRYNDEIIEYVTPTVFVAKSVQRSLDDENITEIENLRVFTDRDPTYYTSFDDNELCFDAYDSEEGSTLMESHTLCWGQLETPFLMEDDFVPALPLEMFPRLLAEAKAVCFINFKQVANSKEEQRARQQKVANSNNRFKAGERKPIDRLPDYARKR